MNYEIKLPLFEGPFDLLLFFIERDELDIYDIPISKITEDFLDYLKHLEKMNIEVASEFILVAATLMRIKSRMLLPRPQIDELGNEIDPREELVMHLLEYKKYKSVVADLASMEEERMLREKRGNISKEIRFLSETVNVEAELQSVDLYKLLKVYQKVLYRYDAEQSKPRHQVVEFAYSMAEQKHYLLNTVKREGSVSFIKIIEDNPDKIAVIFNILSILELLQSGELKIKIGEGFNNFWIEPISDSLMAEH